MNTTGQDTETTKCRVCGTMTEWYLWPTNSQEVRALIAYKYDRIQAPTLRNCSHCECETVHDTVKFNF